MAQATDRRADTGDALLADGSTVHIRPIVPEDADNLVVFHSQLSPDSVYLRYFSAHPRLRPEEVTRLVTVDGHDRMALVATRQEQLLGVARYDRLGAGNDEAEVAFLVADRYQGLGIGTLLLEWLAEHARREGIAHFRAQTLWQNQPMLGVFRRAGFEVEISYDRDVVDVSFPIQPTPRFLASVDARNDRAEVMSLRRLLAPLSVAVLGAGPAGDSVGRSIYDNIVAGGFAGAAYAVTGDIAGAGSHLGFRGLGDIPAEVELAVVAVPGAAVPGALEECVLKGVHGVVLISGGGAHWELEDAALARTRSAGIRIIGPGCEGFVNNSSAVSLSSVPASGRPGAGRIALVGQEGRLAADVLAAAESRHLGLSTFVSLGRHADVDVTDLLPYLYQDPDTDVILVALESIAEVGLLEKAARRLSADKVLVAIGAVPERSATAGLTSAARNLEPISPRSGVICAGSVAEMLDLAEVLQQQR